MKRLPLLVAERFAPVTLEALEASAGLLDRVDRKYVVPARTYADVAELLTGTHSVLEIDGVRAFEYRTTYYDTPHLETYRDHVQGRRRRYKCRSRLYVDSGGCAFELKLKGLRGRTMKHRMAYDASLHGSVSADALRFAQDTVDRHCGRSPHGLDPVLHMTYRRVTLVDRERSERLTCDYDLRFHDRDGRAGALLDDVVILESKSGQGAGVGDRLLHRVGARAVSACSKYCLGVGLTRPDVRANPFRPMLRRWFTAVPAAV